MPMTRIVNMHDAKTTLPSLLFTLRRATRGVMPRYQLLIMKTHHVIRNIRTKPCIFTNAPHYSTVTAQGKQSPTPA